jgi:precorrin-4/cobalt-precorrin-4 C11-methyltransferase
MRNLMKNKVVFAGAGPGAPDLMTLRCLNAIKKSNVIIYAGSLISEKVIQLFRNDCEAYDSAGMILDDVIDLIEKKYNEGKNVLRLHSGDPSMYGTLIEQFNRLDKNNIEYEVIPGVSSVFASAAALKTELTLPAVSQTVILTRNSGKTPVPPEETLEKLAHHQATMAIFLSIQEIDEVVSKLICGGYSGDTPIAVVYRATWPDEKIIRGTLSSISKKVKKKILQIRE